MLPEQILMVVPAALAVMAVWICENPGFAQLVFVPTGAFLFTHAVVADARAGTETLPAHTAITKIATFRAALTVPPWFLLVMLPPCMSNVSLSICLLLVSLVPSAPLP
jgi:hypothetical protein